MARGELPTTANPNTSRVKRDYVAGWLDSSISDFLAFIPRSSLRTAFALITSLDSDPTPAKLLGTSQALKSLGKAARPLGSGIIVPTELILAADVGIFRGFDEVWFFPHEKIAPKPRTAWLVGPNRLDQKKLDRVGSWMSANECSLGLGDGEGLNFVVKARGLIKHLLACSLCQPQPVTGGEEEEPAEAVQVK